MLEYLFVLVSVGSLRVGLCMKRDILGQNRDFICPVLNKGTEA